MIGCGDESPVSSTSEEGIAAPAGKLTVSATKAGGLRSGKELRRIFQAGTEVWNAHDLDALPSSWTDDVVGDYVPFSLVTEGKDALLALNADFMRVFPDIQWDNQRILTSGNILVAEWIATGTQQEEFLGNPPSGMGGSTPHLNINEYEGGKLKRTTTYLDYVTVLVLIGAMPPSELPPLEPSFTLPDPEPTGLSPIEASRDLVLTFNTHDLSVYMQRVHKDAEIFFGPIGVPIDRTAFAALLELYLLGFPDLEGEIIRTVDLGDGWVLQEVLWAGTNDGPYFGIPATGLPSQTRSAFLNHVDADGLLTEMRHYFDGLGILVNIGVVPAP